MVIKTPNFSRWKQFRTTVRYRLLILTSAPIILTITALILLSVYWTTTYTWQSTLQGVSERLRVARNSIDILLDKQALTLHSISDSYHFIQLLHEYSSVQDLNLWLFDQLDHFQLDFAYFYDLRNGNPINVRDDIQLGSYFAVVSAETLTQWNPILPQRAIIRSVENQQPQTKALITQTTIQIFDQQGNVIGYLLGGKLLNHSSEVVDRIRDLIYPSPDQQYRPNGSVTLFLDGLRVSTNIPISSDNSSSKRAIGTSVSSEVYQQVIVNGKEWLDLAYILDRWHVSGYQPIRNAKQQVIGMLYTGYPLWPILSTYMVNLLEIGLSALLLLVISGSFVYRSSRALFKPIEKISHIVAAIKRGDSVRIGQLKHDAGSELASLAQQFDLMIDKLEQQHQAISSFAKSLEEKVAERTTSLKEKTSQLEEHIRLLEQTRRTLIAKEKFAALGELTAGIAHEINNPIAVILGNAELIRLQLQQGNDEVSEELETICKQVDRVRDITRSLLQYSHKQESQNSPGERQSINPIIEESITLVRTGENKRNIRYNVTLSAQNWVIVNRHQLLQVLVNLQVNAIQAMHGNGTITITSEDWGDEQHNYGILISVCDEGDGIAPQHIQKVFDPFFTTKKEGTGLGLSVSQTLIGQMGGDIQVKSDEHMTCFTLFLPSDLFFTTQGV